MQNLNWDDLRLLLAVSRHDSLLDAGRALGVATTTVSRRIAALESYVGTQLVHRSHVGTRLTVAGQRLVQAVEPLSLEIEASVRATVGADSQISGAIKLSVAEGLAPLVLDALHVFRSLHPGVVFELDVSHRSLDMAQSEADVALRFVRPRSDGLVVRRVSTVNFGVYGASQWVAARALRSPGDTLARSDAVVLGGELGGLKESVWLCSRVRSVVLQTQTLGALIDAVRRGMGVGVVPDELAAGDTALRRICDCEAVPHKSLWLVMNQRTAKTARVRALADHLTAHVRDFVAHASSLSL